MNYSFGHNPAQRGNEGGENPHGKEEKEEEEINLLISIRYPPAGGAELIAN